MPRIEAQTSERIISSVGGSIIRPDRLNQPVVDTFMEFCRNVLHQNKAGIFIIGGGGQARHVIEDAKAMGVTDPDALDRLGIQVTWQNVFMLHEIFTAGNIAVAIRTADPQPQSGIIYLQGGGAPGHTTDYEAVKAAIQTGEHLVVNISNTPGLHPALADGSLKTDEIISEISIDRYLNMFTPGHEPGRNLPFDTNAALLAREHDITIALSGADFSNVFHILNGENFEGTLITPVSQTVHP